MRKIFFFICFFIFLLSFTTHTIEAAGCNSLSVNPNPAKTADQITVSFSPTSSAPVEYRIEVFDQNRTLKETKNGISASSGNTNVEVGPFVEGGNFSVRVSTKNTAGNFELACQTQFAITDAPTPTPIPTTTPTPTPTSTPPPTPTPTLPASCRGFIGKTCDKNSISSCQSLGGPSECINIYCLASGYGGTYTCQYKSSSPTPTIGPTNTPIPTSTPPPPLPPCEKWEKIGDENTQITTKELIALETEAYKNNDKEPNKRKEYKCAVFATGLGIDIATDPASFLKTIFGILLSISGAIALILIIVSGYQMIASRGNAEKLQGARETLTSAIVGLLFIIFSIAILEFIGVDLLHIPGFGK